jgi:hypothetical protein
MALAIEIVTPLVVSVPDFTENMRKQEQILVKECSCAFQHRRNESQALHVAFESQRRHGL